MIVYNDFSLIYNSLIEKLHFYGFDSEPYENGSINRQRKTRYLENIAFQIRNIHSNLVYIPDRKFSIIHAITEFIMMFSNRDELKYYEHFNGNIKNYSDDGLTLKGNYSKRIYSYNGFQKIIDILKNDSGSRQAVLTIFDSSKDLNTDSKDIPCTLSITFSMKDERLNMSVHMRSNDVIWGLPYDVFVFTNIQRVIANTLDLGYGTYTHYIDNLHYYLDQSDILNNLLINGKNYKELRYFVFEDLKEMEDLANKFIDFIDHQEIESLNESHLKVLKCEELYRIKGEVPNSLLENVFRSNYSVVHFTKRYNW